MPPGPFPARAACGDGAEDVQDLWSITEPAGAGFFAQGSAPLRVTLSIRGGVVEFGTGEITAVLDWGDGTGATTVATQPCGDGETSFWPQQDLTHIYATAGSYSPVMTISLNVPVPDVPSSFAFTPFGVQVDAAQAPTAVPTPTEAVAATPTPPPAQGTAAPSPTPGAGSTSVTSATAAASPSSSVQPPTAAAPGRGETATPSPRPGTTPSATATATASAAAAAATGTEEPPNPAVPELAAALPEVGDVSTEPDVVATNIVIAGFTVWVLFTSVLLNQVLQDNREEVERRTSWLRPREWRLTRWAFRGGGRRNRLSEAAQMVGVLAITGAIYTLAEPGLGLNRQTAVLFVSVIAGVGIVSYAVSGIEARSIRRIAGAPAAVRPYAATIAVAAVSLLVTKLFDLRPGIVYGFVASTTLLAAASPDRSQAGRIAARPVLAGLVIAVGAWLAVGPLRSAAAGSDSWLLAVAESTAVIVCVGGIEGAVFAMIPVAETDGGKLYRWNRAAWLAITLPSAFLMWHVLLGREQAYFSGLRQAQSMTVVVVFAVYSLLTIAAWAYFHFRDEPAAAA
ncbi:MAG: hypothetical protein HY875_14695 [Chloroflexi bacterium]|nr:hypothetical protein [Chloroflexota bacterium]